MEQVEEKGTHHRQPVLKTAGSAGGGVPGAAEFALEPCKVNEYFTSSILSFITVLCDKNQ